MDAVLLDLDGTLVDTAPDLVDVLNALLKEDDQPPLPFALARNEVSNGALGLIRRGYGSCLADFDLPNLRQRFLDKYAERICESSKIFSGLHDLLYNYGAMFSGWGIVTNKPQALTERLLTTLGIDRMPHCVVSGDQLPQRKPHPAPLLHAAALLQTEPRGCVYVGDANRDIVAGKSAGMMTVIAAYGYIRPGENLDAWNADAIVTRPRDMLRVLGNLTQRRK